MRRNGGLYRIHYYDKQEKKKENKGFSLNFFSPSSAMILIGYYWNQTRSTNDTKRGTRI